MCGSARRAWEPGPARAAPERMRYAAQQAPGFCWQNAEPRPAPPVPEPAAGAPLLPRPTRSPPVPAAGPAARRRCPRRPPVEPRRCRWRRCPTEPDRPRPRRVRHRRRCPPMRRSGAPEARGRGGGTRVELELSGARRGGQLAAATGGVLAAGHGERRGPGGIGRVVPPPQAARPSASANGRAAQQHSRAVEGPRRPPLTYGRPAGPLTDRRHPAPQCGQSLRSFWASWSHQLQKRRFSTRPGQLGDGRSQRQQLRRRPRAARRSHGRRNRRPGSASITTSRPRRRRPHTVLLADPHRRPCYQGDRGATRPAAAPFRVERRAAARIE